MTRRLNALIHNDDGYSTAVTDVLDDAIDLRDDAKRWKQDDIDKSLTVACLGCHLLTATERRAKTERETMETSTLREYTVLFAIVSELYRRFDPHVHRRADRADVDQAKESIGLAIHTRREGDIDRAVSYLYRAMTSSRRERRNGG